MPPARTRSHPVHAATTLTAGQSAAVRPGLGAGTQIRRLPHPRAASTRRDATAHANGPHWTHRYEATAKAISALATPSAYVDGELCAIRADGTTAFAEMQAATDEGRTTNLEYFVFDLLLLDGQKLAEPPLLERKGHLKALVEHAPPSILYGDHHIGDGQRFLEAGCGAKAEGIISKRVDAPYVWGDRGVWRKSKCYQREEFIIVDYSEPEGSRAYIGALLLKWRAHHLSINQQERIIRRSLEPYIPHPDARDHVV
jgi:hypothetical protein